VNQHIIFQKIESALILAVSTYVYFDLGFSLIAYLLLLFIFDVSMVGYLKSSRVGAYIYNLGHSLTLPVALLLVSWVTGSDMVLGLSLIWFSHVGLDRMLGYGLKLSDGFRKTHLGVIGS
jgi:hypothetical protein